MPEANVLYSVTAAVVAGLVVWVAVVLKSAKEPWGRETPKQASSRGDDVPIEKVDGEGGGAGGESADGESASGITERVGGPPSSSLPKVLAGSAGGASADTTAEATAVVVAKKEEKKADADAKADAKADADANADDKADDKADADAKADAKA